MSKIFISYRREDTADVTGRINDRLREQFGEREIFTDIDNIPLGVDFRDYIDRGVSQCDVLLAVIGKDWLTTQNSKNKSRLNDSADFVRIEIESALSREIPIIPLLVQGADMPRENELPEALRSLAFRNATKIRADPDFNNDANRLVRSLATHLQGTASDATTTDPEVVERYVARHVGNHVGNSAADDIAQIRSGRDMSMKADTTQIDEINKWKNELALARQSLDRNRAEFNAFRNEKQTEKQSLENKLARYQSGSSIHNIAKASETIEALRTAVRENDKVIDSLRQRIKEGDAMVENLRSQLKSSDSQTDQIRDFNTTLEARNREYDELGKRLEDLRGNIKQKDSQFVQLKAELDKQEREKATRETNANKWREELRGLKIAVEEKESNIVSLRSRAGELEQSGKHVKEMETQLAEVIRSTEASAKKFESIILEQRKKLEVSEQEIASLKGLSARRESDLEARLQGANRRIADLEK